MIRLIVVIVGIIGVTVSTISLTVDMMHHSASSTTGWSIMFDTIGYFGSVLAISGGAFGDD
jgi:hypothetical protein